MNIDIILFSNKMTSIYDFGGNNPVEKLNNVRLSKTPYLIVNGRNLEYKIVIKNYWCKILLYEMDTDIMILSMEITYGIRLMGDIMKGKYITRKEVIIIVDNLYRWLKLNSCYVSDAAYLECEIGTVSISQLLLLSDCETYYEKNGFIPIKNIGLKLWTKFLEIRETKLRDLNIDLSKLYYEILNYKEYIDLDITLGDFFKYLKNTKDCDFQYKIMDIMEMKNLYSDDIISWQKTVYDVYREKSLLVKHYINILDISEYKNIEEIHKSGFYPIEINKIFRPNYFRDINEKYTYIKIIDQKFLVKIDKDRNMYVYNYTSQINDILYNGLVPDKIISIVNNEIEYDDPRLFNIVAEIEDWLILSQ